MSSMNAYNSAQVIGHPMVRGGQRSGVPVKRPEPQVVGHPMVRGGQRSGMPVKRPDPQSTHMIGHPMTRGGQRSGMPVKRPEIQTAPVIGHPMVRGGQRSGMPVKRSTRPRIVPREMPSLDAVTPAAAPAPATQTMSECDVALAMEATSLSSVVKGAYELEDAEGCTKCERRGHTTQIVSNDLKELNDTDYLPVSICDSGAVEHLHTPVFVFQPLYIACTFYSV